MKNSGIPDRNWFKGAAGDVVHIVPCAADQNLPLTLKAIEAFFVRYTPRLKWRFPGNRELWRLGGLISFPHDGAATLLTLSFHPSCSYNCLSPSA